MVLPTHSQASRRRRLGLTEDGNYGLEQRLKGIEQDLQWKGRYVDILGPSTAGSPALPSEEGRRNDLLRSYEILQLDHFGYSHPFAETSTNLTEMSQLA